jgi:hypothetical protein
MGKRDKVQRSDPLVSAKDKAMDILSQGIERLIAVDLLESYETVRTCYWKSNWEDTLGKSRKFAENSFRAVKYLAFGIASPEILAGEITQLVEDLERIPKAECEESVRILLPRATSLVNDFSSKRGGTHVKPLSPSFTDATLCVSLCSWILAELVRICARVDTKSAELLIRDIVRRQIPLVQEFGKKDWLVLSSSHTGQDELLLLLFHAKQRGLSGLTRKELGKLSKKSPSNVTLSLDDLIKERMVHFSEDRRRYIITEVGEQRVERMLREATLSPDS